MNYLGLIYNAQLYKAPKRVFDVNPETKIIVTLCDPVVRMLNHIDSSYKASKKWPLKTKMNHFETFDFAFNFPSDLFALINHDLSQNSGPTSEEEPTEEDKLEKMMHYARTTNGM